MNQFPDFIQKAFRTKEKQQRQKVEFSLADQIANFIPLLELQDRRQLLHVQVLGNGHSQSYQSMIVGVDFIKQQLLLDTLMPINPYCPIIIGDKLIVTHQRQGQVLSFVGKLIDVFSDSDSLVYVMELPNEIAYKQRRFYPRLPAEFLQPPQDRFLAKLKSPLKTPWHCALKNISAGGIRVSVPGKVSPQLHIGQLLPTATFLIGDISISSQLTVKSFRHERRPYEHTDISLGFSGINFQDRLRLQNFISFHLEDLNSHSMTLAS